MSNDRNNGTFIDMALTSFPQRMTLDLTAECNQRCSYCCFFHSRAESDHTDLPGSEWKQFLVECGRCGVMEVILRGGEPLIRKDFPELIQTIVDNRMRYRLQTNGLLLDRKLAEFLAAGKRCNLIKFSLDGPREIHDASRGNGTYDAALKGIENARNCGLPIAVTATIHNHNYKHLREIVRYLAGELKLPMVTLSGVMPGSATPGWELSLEAVWELQPVLKELDGQYHNDLPSRGIIGTHRLWQKLFHASSASGDIPPASGSCGAFSVGFAVRADGVYVPCVEMMDRPLGRINTDSLTEIWRNSQALAALRRFRLDPAELEECRACRYRQGCRYGCPARSGTPYGNYGCLRKYTEVHGDAVFQ